MGKVDYKKRPLEQLLIVAEIQEFLKNLEQEPNLSYNNLSRKILSQILEIVQDFLGTELYVRSGHQIDFQEISEATRRLINSLFNKKIINALNKAARLYHDEPYFIRYSAELCDTVLLSDAGKNVGRITGGSDLEPEKALMKAIGEGVERHCLGIYQKKNFVVSSYDEIKDQAINPVFFATISPIQKEKPEFLRWQFDKKSIFQWDKCFSLPNKKPIFIPAQLIYVPYKYFLQEPIIQLPLSTGAAAGHSLEEALYRGICEVVERDAFMITYLNKLSPPIIDITSSQDDRIKEITAAYKRYNLEHYALDITTDIELPTAMILIIDRTGIGPAVTVATKTSVNILEAIIGATYEAQKTRVWIRDVMKKGDYNLKNIKSMADKISDFIDRGLFWSSTEMIKHIEFLFQGSKKILEGDSSVPTLDYQANYQKVITLFVKKDIPVYAKDLTTPEINSLNFKVVKVIIPQLQPLYLWEQFRYLGSNRLYQAPISMGHLQAPLSMEKLNNVPHPFL